MKFLSIEIWVFMTVFVITIILSTVYIIIKPDKSVIQGFSPFPDIYPTGVPPPQQQVDIKCKNTIQSCVVDSDCDKCGAAGFVCTEVKNGQQTIFDGKKVPQGNWCLPKNEKGCGTYTGRAIWATVDGEEKWKCTCLYPDLFGGADCLTQYACRDNTGPTTQTDNVLEGTLDGKKVIWDPNKFPPNGLSPYARDKDENPIFSCSCKQGDKSKINFTSLPNNPYKCNIDPCTLSHNSTYFNSKTNTCDCPKDLPVLSNVTGVCEADGCSRNDTLGFWDSNTGQCVCSGDLWPVENCSNSTFYRSNTEKCTAALSGIPGGSTCLNPCKPNPCKNGSICVHTPNAPGKYECSCPPGFGPEPGLPAYCSRGCYNKGKGGSPPGCDCATTKKGDEDVYWGWRDRNCEYPCLAPGVVTMTQQHGVGILPPDNCSYIASTGKNMTCCNITKSGSCGILGSTSKQYCGDYKDGQGN